MAKIHYDDTELNSIMKMLKDDYTLRVGIMGSKASAQHGNDNISNVYLGTIHELGLGNNPQRSFLFKPLQEKLQFTDPEMAQLKKAVFTQFFVKNTPLKFFQDLGVKALEVVENAFNTNGFGEWKPLTVRTENQFSKARKRKIKKNGYQILTDTGRLRRSITFKVKKRGS